MIQFQRVTLIFKEAPSAFVVIVVVVCGDVVGVVDVGRHQMQPTNFAPLRSSPIIFSSFFFTRGPYNKTLGIRNYNLIIVSLHLSSRNN